MYLIVDISYGCKIAIPTDEHFVGELIDLLLKCSILNGYPGEIPNIEQVKSVHAIGKLDDIIPKPKESN